MNGLDLLLTAVFMGIIAAAFFNGVIKVFASIVAVYAATIMAAAFYQPATKFAVGFMPSMSRSTGQLVLFFVFFLIFSGVFTYLLARWISGVRVPRPLRILDNISGAVVGVVVSGLALTVLAMILTVAYSELTRFGTEDGGPIVAMFVTSIGNSNLVPIFMRLAPYFAQAIEPWFPGGLPPILGVSIS